MERILLAIDGSEHATNAVRYAATLAQSLRSATVCILTIQPPIHDWQTHGIAHEQITKMHAQTAGKILDDAAAILTATGVPCEREYRHADTPAAMIVQVANEQHATLIVMGSRGHGAIANLALGSTANKVIHLASIPVLIVK